MFAPYYSTWVTDNTTKRLAQLGRRNLRYSAQNKDFIQKNPAMRALQIAQQQSMQDALTGKVLGTVGKGLYYGGKTIAATKPIQRALSWAEAGKSTPARATATVANAYKTSWDPNRLTKARAFIGPHTANVSGLILNPLQEVINPLSLNKIPGKTNTFMKWTGASLAPASALLTYTGKPVLKDKKQDAYAKEAMDWAGWLNPGVKGSYAFWQHTPFGAGTLTGLMRKYTATPEKVRNLYYFMRKANPQYFAQFQSPQGMVKYLSSLGAKKQDIPRLIADILRNGKDIQAAKRTGQEYMSKLDYSMPFSLLGAQPRYIPTRQRNLGYHGDEKTKVLRDVIDVIRNNK